MCPISFSIRRNICSSLQLMKRVSNSALAAEDVTHRRTLHNVSTAPLIRIGSFVQGIHPKK